MRPGRSQLWGYTVWFTFLSISLVLVCLPSMVEADEAEPQTVNDLLEGLRQNGNAAKADALSNEVKRSQEEARAYRTKHVVVGRVRLEGDGDPRYISSQMVIMEDGYYVTAIRDTDRPLELRMHGYVPVDIKLRPTEGTDLIYAGDVLMERTKPNQQVKITGQFSIENKEGLPTAQIQLWPTVKANSPSGGTKPRRHHADPITILTDEQGNFSQGGLSPGRYYTKFTAKNNVDKAEYIELKEGENKDLGTIQLEAPISLEIEYRLARGPDFRNGEPARLKMVLGELSAKFQPIKAIPGADFEIQQKNQKLYFRTFYSPMGIAYLGQGTLKHFEAIDPTQLKLQSPSQVTIEDGGVYVMESSFKHWVLFRLTKLNN